jgi:hypothetical protein
MNDVNDPAPGQSLASPSGSIIQPYTGQVGGRLVLTTPMALKLSNTAIGTLYEGVYQYVQFLSTATAAAVRGQLCYWSNRANGVVTSDQTATNCSLWAGWFINVITKGNYGFIQISGRVTALSKSTVTKTTPAIGDLVVIDSSTSPTVDTLADATAITNGNAKLIVGTAIEALASGALKQIDAWPLRQVFPSIGGF